MTSRHDTVKKMREWARLCSDPIIAMDIRREADRLSLEPLSLQDLQVGMQVSTDSKRLYASVKKADRDRMQLPSSEGPTALEGGTASRFDYTGELPPGTYKWTPSPTTPSATPGVGTMLAVACRGRGPS